MTPDIIAGTLASIFVIELAAALAYVARLGGALCSPGRSAYGYITGCTADLG